MQSKKDNVEYINEKQIFIISYQFSPKTNIICFPVKCGESFILFAMIFWLNQE